MSNKISDVAKLSGVSPATVSRVFNKHPYVKERIRKRVLASARKLGYAPKSSRAQSAYGIMVRGDRYLSLGAYESQLVAGISKTFFDEGFDTVITTDNQVDFLHGSSFRALVMLTGRIDESLLELGIPVVLVNNLLAGFSSVVTDHFQGVELAVDYLVSHGHEKIAFISGAGRNWGGEERLKGYRSSLLKHGLEFDPNLHEEAEKSGVIQEVVKLMSRKPTAIVLAGEGRAQHLTHALYLLDKKIPDDVSVVTCEDPEVSRYLTPPHTTISQNLANLAKTAAELAMKLASGGDSGNVERIMLPNELIERDSVKSIL